jgi:AcrR family transcriptional regulator
MAAKARADQSERVESSKPSLQARKQELVREMIWVAAIDLFAAKGFEETTIDEIVDAAGSSRRTFFRHFESKRDLIAHPVVSYGASLTKAIESCPAKSSPAELFRHVVLEVAQRTVSDTRTRQVMEISAKYPAAREAQLSRVAEVQDRVAEAFARRCKGEFTAHVLAGLTLSALSLAYRAWFSEGKKDIGSAVERLFTEFSTVVCSESANRTQPRP